MPKVLDQLRQAAVEFARTYESRDLRELPVRQGIKVLEPLGLSLMGVVRRGTYAQQSLTKLSNVAKTSLQFLGEVAEDPRDPRLLAAEAALQAQSGKSVFGRPSGFPGTRATPSFTSPRGSTTTRLSSSGWGIQNGQVVYHPLSDMRLNAQGGAGMTLPMIPGQPQRAVASPVEDLRNVANVTPPSRTTASSSTPTRSGPIRPVVTGSTSPDVSTAMRDVQASLSLSSPLPPSLSSTAAMRMSESTSIAAESIVFDKPSPPITTPGWCLTSKSLRASLSDINTVLQESIGKIPGQDKETLDSFRTQVTKFNTNMNGLLGSAGVVVVRSSEVDAATLTSGSNVVSSKIYLAIPPPATSRATGDQPRFVGATKDVAPMDVSLLREVANLPSKHLAPETYNIMDASNVELERMLNGMGIAIGNGVLLKNDPQSTNAAAFKRLYQLSGKDNDFVEGLLNDKNDFIVITTKMKAQAYAVTTDCRPAIRLVEQEVRITAQDNIVSGGDYDYLYVFWKDRVRATRKSFWQMDLWSLSQDQRSRALSMSPSDNVFVYVLDTTLWPTLKDLGDSFLSVDTPYGVDLAGNPMDVITERLNGNTGSGSTTGSGMDSRFALASLFAVLDVDKTLGVSKTFDAVKDELKKSQAAREVKTPTRDPVTEEYIPPESPSEEEQDDGSCFGLDYDLASMEELLSTLEQAKNQIMAAVKKVQSAMHGLLEQMQDMVNQIESFLNNKLGSLSSILACLFGGFGLGVALPSFLLGIFEAIDAVMLMLQSILDFVFQILSMLSSTLCLSFSLLEAMLPIPAIPGFLNCFSLGLDLPDCIWDVIRKLMDMIQMIQQMIGALMGLLNAIKMTLSKLAFGIRVDMLNKLDQCNDQRLVNSVRALTTAISSV